MRKPQPAPAGPGRGDAVLLCGFESVPGREQRRHIDFCPHTCQEAGVCLWTLSLLPGPLFASLLYNTFNRAKKRVVSRAGRAAGPKRGTLRAKRWHDAAPRHSDGTPEPGHWQDCR